MVVCKVWLGDDCRRVALPDGPGTLTALQAMVRTTFALPPDAVLVLRYRDADGDMVTLAADADLAHLGPAPVRLAVSVVGDAASDPDPARFAFDPPKVLDRSHFAADFTNNDILEVLRDISYYISARDHNARVRTRVSGEKTLLRPQDVMPTPATLATPPPRSLTTTAVHTWRHEDVAAWLARLGLASLQPAFRDNDIQGDVLLDLTHETLREMGVTAVGQRLRLLRALEQLRTT